MCGGRLEHFRRGSLDRLQWLAANRPMLGLGLALTSIACQRAPAPPTLDGGPSVAEAKPPLGGLPAKPVPASDASSKQLAWNGKYVSSAGTLYIPVDWKGVHWAGAVTGQGVGDGTLTLIADDATKRVRGTLEGALGSALVDGYLGEGWLSAHVSRRDPSDNGFTGTLYATLTDAGASGTIRATTAEAESVRVANFELTRGGSDLSDAPTPERPPSIEAH